MELYKKLDLLCRIDGVSRPDLAGIAGGVSVSTINNWFSGKTKPDLVAGLRIARHFGVPLEWLADDGDSIFPERFEKSAPPGIRLADDEKLVLKVYRTLRSMGTMNEDHAIGSLVIRAANVEVAKAESTGETMAAVDRMSRNEASIFEEAAKRGYILVDPKLGVNAEAGDTEDEAVKRINKVNDLMVERMAITDGGRKVPKAKKPSDPKK
ncbi:helix-turn-helix transcriptional regulator [Singulisphaera acidiphila]|uniref:Putative transcriptional regulator n=1 Tax=Singulisphaera acidiphila (strain ATCC BAA-1392 / DSM 18658 / VKM B-2454 / MOB10) TaxID=886293 RepID=L0DIU0_SINAD|nr:helix-turn-helix transcriptional regulator [Singulisphaera acidiphila]AGA28733.1 putative transcriptional regulator [Singulisphaera acidiphila DSM 18658]